MPVKEKAPKKAAPKTARKVTPADAWAAIERLAQETEKARQENEKARQENEKARRELQKTVERVSGDIGKLGKRFGEFAESTLVPGLVAKFKKHGFSFNKMSERVQIDDEAHGIHMELDALLENGTDAMAVEVKVHLKTDDVKEHTGRMEKVRAYADLHNDGRRFFGAIAATVINRDVKTYALKQGFYIIEPSGESVKIVPPVSQAKVW